MKKRILKVLTIVSFIPPGALIWLAVEAIVYMANGKSVLSPLFQWMQREP